MTALTAAQRNQSYRARRKAKLERLAVLEGALREIEATCGPFSQASVIARKALGDVG